MKFPLPFLLSLFFISNLNAQLSNEQIKKIISTGDENQLLKENSRLMYEGFHYQAELVMNKLIEFQPENPNYNYRKGFLLLEMQNDYKAAIPYFEKSITKTKKVFDAFSTNEEFAPTDAYYQLGKCYHMDGQIDKAEEQYKLFLDNSNSESELISRAQLGLMQCMNARNEINTPKKVNLKNLGAAVNTVNSEYSSVVSLDGSAIYFTSKRPWSNNETENFRDIRKGQLPEDVYVSNSDNNRNRLTAERLKFCEPQRSEASIGVSFNDRYIYLYQDSTGFGDIYFTDLYGQSFDQIAVFDQPKINSQYWETHIVNSVDGNTIIFASDRPGGFGGLDLYILNKINGIWSEPTNMGSHINSAFDEDAPFLTANGKTLYFASNGPSSIGGYDIFSSIKNSDGTWTLSKNAGYPLNSTTDDIYFSCTIDEKRAFITSSRPNGFGGSDIYEIEDENFGKTSSFNLLGKIRNSNGGDLPKDFAVNMELKCTDCNNTAPVLIFPRLSDGIFMASLERCKNYELYYYTSATKKILYQTKFNTSCSLNEELIEKEVILDDKNSSITPILLYNIKGIVADVISGKEISNALITVKLASGEVIQNSTSDLNGTFNLDFLKNKKFGEKISFQVSVTANGYLTKVFNVDQKLGNEEVISLTCNLEQLNIGSDLAKSFGVKSIYFDFNKSNLRKDALKELDKIVKIMNDNPTLYIEYGAHTDCSGPDVYNQYLSDMRASSVADYIKSKITNPERIIGKGYGESQPISNCSCDELKNACTTSQNQANRRAVFKVIQK
jgi:outer membrane protein OmpA-like peptidoglycan-associated protein